MSERDAGEIPEPDGGMPFDAGADAGILAVGCALEPFGEVQLVDSTGHSSQAPDLAWNGDGVSAVVMEGGGDTSHPFVTLVEISPLLTRIGGPIVAGPEAHGWGEIATASRELALCYHGDPGGRGRTIYRRVREDRELGPIEDIDPAGESCLDLAVAGGSVLVLLRHTDESGLVETRAVTMSLDGAPIGEPLALALAPYPGRNATVTSDGSSFYIAVADADVRIWRTSPDGEVLDEARIASVDARTAMALPAHGRVALLVGRGPPEVRRLSLAMLTPDLAALGTPPRELTDGAPSAAGATIEALPDGFLIAWSDEHQPSNALALLHVDVSGAPREARVVAHRGQNSGYGGPSIAAEGANVYVGYSRAVGSSGIEHVFVEGWRCEPAELDPCAPQRIVEAECDTPERAAWRWDGRECQPVLCASGCSGPDCDRLAPSEHACAVDHAECVSDRACAPEPVEFLDRWCTSNLTPNERDPMSIRVDRTVECACATQLDCTVRVVEPFRIALDVTSCLLPVACACTRERVSATCHLPALSAGTWTIESAGLAAVPIEIAEPWETAPITPFCTDDK